MRLVELLPIEGLVHCMGGTKIGASKTSYGIAETDNPIIRHPITGLPYLPGSSIKGSIRSALEIAKGKAFRGSPCNCGNPDCDICSLFGSLRSHSPTRLIFRDADLTLESKKILEEVLPGSFVEIKAEVAIDRETNRAAKTGPRDIERVPADVDFNFRLMMRIYDIDQSRVKDQLKLIAEGLELVEKQYLGGCGTRGYGEVRFLTKDRKPLSDYIRTLK